jgi:hypothetical protein
MNAIEKAAKKYSESEIMETYDSALEALKRISFIAGVEFAQQWISVEDELPEIEIEVIVKTINSKYSISKMYIPKDYNGTILGKKEWKGSGTFKSSITHWRQINLK